MTVTGFRRISAANLHPICNRHGQTYTAELNGSEEAPYLSLKFKDAPDHDLEKPPVVDAIASLNTDTVDAFTTTVCRALECALVSTERAGDTYTFHFDAPAITMERAVSLLQHPSAAIIDVVLALDGLIILYSARSDSKNNLR